MKLNRYLLLSFSLLIISVLLIVSIGSGLSIRGSFDAYLLESQLDKVEGLKVLLGKVFNKNEEVEASMAVLEDYLERNRLLLRLTTIEGDLLYENSKMPGKGMGSGMMGRMLPHLNQERIEIKSNGKIIAYAQVGYFGDYQLSVQANAFRQSMQGALVLTAVLSLLIGLGLSYYLAGKINGPIAAVSRVTKAISEGNLKTRTEHQTTLLELKGLSEHVDRMADQLDQQEELRRNLMLSMGHEVKTPLTIIKTQLEGFMDQIVEPTADNFKSTYEEVERLQSIVENIELLSTLGEVQVILSKEPIRLSDEIEKSIAAFQSRLKESDLSLEVIGKCDTICTDRIKVRQVIDNLMINITKYATPHTSIVVSLKQEKTGSEVKFQNQAPTLMPSDLDRIFDIHFRTDTAKSKEGRGIGLYVTKALIHQLKGRIQVESKEGQFTVTLSLPSL